MRNQWKLAFAVLSLLIALPAARAQAPDQIGPADRDPAFEQQGPPASPHRDGDWDGPRGGAWRGGFERGGWRGGRMAEMRGRRGGEFMLARLVSNPTMRDRLGVTADQAAKIRQQTADFRKAQIRNRAGLEIKRLELRELLAADNPDRGAIDRKLQEISTAQLAQSKSTIDFRLDMRNALTPEQRQKLQQMREQRRRGPAGPRGGARGAQPNRPPQPPSPQDQSDGE